MKNRILLSCLLALIPLSTGCQSEAQTDSAQQQMEEPAQQSAKSAAVQSQEGVFAGQIVETMNGGGYTYVLLDDGSRKIWAAGPESNLAVGQRVAVQTTMPMRGFRSGALDRTFDEIFFTAGFETPGQADQAHPDPAAAHAPTKVEQKAPVTESLKIAKAESGYTVAELWGRQSELGDSSIEVRGQVVKFLPAIMNRNWIHLKDGTGEGDSEMITVTTAQQAKVGDIVLVRGQLSRDIDFGAGYTYDLIIQDAEITVE